ncbi:ABC transporter ATP-binding protein [Vibrio cholerae]|uniref:ABC transporter ATP-binding protein n=1 Tax=Vibrio cholerae TaxID=666 RepID=UPI00053C49C1|nr:ABC transporter ATP-binding protein [Vibrio cholerae]NOE62306.1 ATP-binding cassette domain-containing protein [Vibrio cholerae]BCN21028.1 putative O-antigen export system, ATP binding protein [Vibrio cholerae]GHX09817.1 ABC transporter family protein [Vibrio cholerae]
MGSIVVTGLGKAYKQYASKFGRLKEWLMPYGKTRHTLKWIIKDISFSVSPGEAIGIIGVNGAGKSTLLKLITGTANPTKGTINMTGRVSALLELGMGFHPDFTGRQNVFMAGQLLGISRNKIIELLPEIEEFSEIGDYIDQPIRMYSSGMQVRLAFSVATAIRPDILIIDEALSVGDAYFQHKSFERIKSFCEQGTTLLLVSHDKAAIQSICNRAILISEGVIKKEGKPDEVMDYYNALLSDSSSVQFKLLDNGHVQTISGSKEAIISRAGLYDINNTNVQVVSTGERVRLKVEVLINENIDNLVLGYVIKNNLGLDIFGTNTFKHGKIERFLKKGQIINYIFEFNANLGEGSYSISLALHADDKHVNKNYQWLDLALVFTVINSEKEHFIGVSWLPPTIEVSKYGQ